MRKSAAVLALVLGAGAAWALTPGDRVYVRGRDVSILQSTATNAATLVKLQPGDAVVWRGADKKKPTWHRVETAGKSGFVYFANLSTTPPASELLTSPAGAKKVDAQAFASSGAAGKRSPRSHPLRQPGGKEQGELRPTMKEAVRQTQTLEAIAAQRTGEEILRRQADRVTGEQR